MDSIEPIQRERQVPAAPASPTSTPTSFWPTRQRLIGSGLPWVMENVPGSPLLDPVTLCGFMFGLELYRHRLFETSFPLAEPPHPEHTIPASKAGHWTPGTIMSVAGHIAPVAHARKIMGIDWMNRDEMAEAIPPAYSEYVGVTLMAVVLDRLNAEEVAA